jgi:hypothetical protein
LKDESICQQPRLIRLPFGPAGTAEIWGANELGDVVDIAIGNASSMSTEFLGESRIALRQVWKEECGILSDQERCDLSDVLKQLDTVMERR